GGRRCAVRPDASRRRYERDQVAVLPEGQLMARRCWTCNSEHDLDAACPSSDTARARRAAGGADDLFDDASDSKLGPIFCAEFESDDSCCGEGIVPGEDIRADGRGGWIHADTTCERLNQ